MQVSNLVIIKWSTLTNLDLYFEIKKHFYLELNPMHDLEVYWASCVVSGRRSRDLKAVGFITTYAISAYHH